MPKFKHNTNWCVFTGAPSSGKTSVINELTKKGFKTKHEAAREVIQKFLDEGHALQDLQHHQQVIQDRIMAATVENEKNWHKDEFMFLDRGVPDGIPFFLLANLDDKEIRKNSLIHKYAQVFAFETLPLVQDGIRKEDEKTVKLLDILLRKEYTHLGYKVINVPVMPINDRTDFICQKLEQVPRISKQFKKAANENVVTKITTPKINF